MFLVWHFGILAFLIFNSLVRPNRIYCSCWRITNRLFRDDSSRILPITISPWSRAVYVNNSKAGNPFAIQCMPSQLPDGKYAQYKYRNKFPSKPSRCCRRFAFSGFHVGGTYDLCDVRHEANWPITRLECCMWLGVPWPTKWGVLAHLTPSPYGTATRSLSILTHPNNNHFLSTLDITKGGRYLVSHM